MKNILNKLLIISALILWVFMMYLTFTSGLTNQKLIIGTSILILILATIINYDSFYLMIKTLSKIELLILTIMITSLSIISYIWKDNTLGIITTLTGIICVVLVSKGSIWNYTFGFVNVIGYSLVAYNSNYAGDFVLNLLYYAPIQFLGLYTWNKHYNSNNDIVQGRNLKIKDVIILITAATIGTMTLTKLMPLITQWLSMGNNPLPIIDSLTTTLSIIAMVLMVQRYSEQWIVWIIINILSIIMWIALKDYIMVIMWSTYLLNSIYGYTNWQNKISH